MSTNSFRSAELNADVSRIMPKRPCAVVITPDDSTILCADKFGDVYSLPMKGQTYEIVAVDDIDDPNRTNAKLGDASEAFVPSANSLTVHTKKNRDALRQQQNLKKRNLEKEAFIFDYRLLLGHVSLLTDIACASLVSPSDQRMNYIITSDRDEHIRVSRGIPQAHLIEGYCLGHTQFVSKLCVSLPDPNLLISGGGDDYLLLWDWTSRCILQKIELKGYVDTFNKQQRPQSLENQSRSAEKDDTAREDTVDTLAVSNILSMNPLPGMSKVRVIVTVEG